MKVMKIIQYLKEHYLLTLILLLASFLRLYHADFQSIWLDEIHTMLESDPELTLRQFDRVMVQREGMGHLYFFALRLLYSVFGYSTLVARVFSGFIGIATVYGIYLFGKIIYNRNAGLIAALLLTINSYHIGYSQEARPYALFVLFAVFSFYRLVLFIKIPTGRNAVIYGVFAGLMVNAHFVGLITVFSQGLLLLFILLLTEKQERKTFFRHCLRAGIIAIALILPTCRIFFKMMGYKSGWLQLPDSEGFTNIFRAFMGSTELLYTIFNVLIIFYLIHLFRQKERGLTRDAVVNNKILFSGIVSFSWMFFSVAIAIAKSYLSEPMIISRYFIHLLPALLVVVAIAIELTRNRIPKIMLVSVIIVFALLDLFLIKDYYNRVFKTQFRELAVEMNHFNKNEEKVVSSFGWLMSYFFKGTDTETFEMNFTDYIEGMRSKKIRVVPFWYMDGNERPYAISPVDEKYLNDNFILKHKLEKYDAWANFYEPKAEALGHLGENLPLDDFTSNTIIKNGNTLFFLNGTARSHNIVLDKGKYNLTILGNSMPNVPIKGENAHLKINYDGNQIGSVFLSEKTNNQETVIPFECMANTKGKLTIIYDNDIFVEGKDRNAIIYSIQITKRE
jgi:hypothetical protein